MQHSREPKNVRFVSIPCHQYSLRSKRAPISYQTKTTPYSHISACVRLDTLRPRYQQAVQHLAQLEQEKKTADTLFQLQAQHIYRPDGKKETIDTILKGSNRAIWLQSLSNEWGRLAQGNDNGVQSTDTIDFINKQDVPSGRDITYATFVLDYHPLKTEPY